MGSCMSTPTESTPPSATAPVPAPAPTPESVPTKKYHERYTPEDIEMATGFSGRRPTEGTAAEYLLTSYTCTIADILNKVKKLPPMIKEIQEDYNKNMSITCKIGKMRRDIDTIRRAYEDFFRASMWQIDENVNERKILSTEGYFTLEDLKDTIEGIARRSFPDFPEAIRSVENQVRMAEELMEHFWRTRPLGSNPDGEDTEL